MLRAINTTAGFVAWGLAFGLCLGALSGTLMLPLVGTMFAAMWGLGIGGGLGLVAGLIAAVTDVKLRQNLTLTEYRRSLSRGIGLLTAIAAPALVFFTSDGILWSSIYQNNYALAREFLLPSLLAAMLGGGLAAAYTATRHADHDTNVGTEESRIDTSAVIGKIIRAAFNRTTFYLGMLAGAAANAFMSSTTAVPFIMSRDPVGTLVIGAIGGVAVTIADVLLLGTANGVMLLFVNRLIFKEYMPGLTLEQYKARVSVLAFLFTLVAGLLVSAFVFAPLSALIAVMAVRKYADWLYDGQEKFKRKSKEDYMAPARLQEPIIETDESLDDAGYDEQVSGRVSR